MPLGVATKRKPKNMDTKMGEGVDEQRGTQSKRDYKQNSSSE